MRKSAVSSIFAFAILLEIVADTRGLLGRLASEIALVTITVFEAAFIAKFA